MKRAPSFMLSALLFLSCSGSNKSPEVPLPPKEPEIEETTAEYSSLSMSGFTVKIQTSEESKTDAKAAITLMQENLAEISTIFPESALEVMKKNIIWLERDVQPNGAAWYHPSKDWLIENDMNPDKAQCVEICNFVNYVSWQKQNQPYMVLHELTHLYHDQYLGNDNAEVEAAYDNAFKSGVYHNSWYRSSKGRYQITEKAYAMDNAREYLSEITEAYFGSNDYFPFNYYDLKECDPTGFELAKSIWGEWAADEIVYSDGVEKPTDEIVEKYDLDPFYRKYIDAAGIPVLASRRVDCKALAKAAEFATLMLEKVPEAVEKMQKNRIRLGVIGQNEECCDLPEHRDLMTVFPETDWNERGRGYGATIERPLVSCAEENILKLEGDVYQGENIMIHEFAHAIHLMGLKEAYPEFQPALEKTYNDAKESGKWNNTYAISNVNEYFAEAIQSYFNVNRESSNGSSDGVHNQIDTRDELKDYDKKIYDLIAKYFTDKEVDY